MVFTYSNQGLRSALPKTLLSTLFLAWSEIHTYSMPTICQKLSSYRYTTAFIFHGNPEEVC